VQLAALDDAVNHSMGTVPEDSAGAYICPLMFCCSPSQRAVWSRKWQRKMNTTNKYFLKEQNT